MSQYKNEEYEHYLMCQLEKTWKKEKPFKGLKILVNAHITSITCVLIQLLKTAGATVDATASIELFAQEDQIQQIRNAHVSFYPDGVIPDEKRHDYYDIVYDCGAGMLSIVRPKMGMIELTHTDITLYQNISFPVITIDNSRTKYLETGFGTGDSVTRVLIQLAKEALIATAKQLVSTPSEPMNCLFSHRQLTMGLFGMMDINSYFKSKKYMIFGYGKVGKGIASALKNAHVPADQIFIVDILPEAYIQIKEDGFHGLYLNHMNKIAYNKSKEEIKCQLRQMFAVITATGVKNAISDIFDACDFSQVPILMNMGTHDEFGYKFSQDMILNKKKPANFLLPYPTQIKFLDAIFSIYAIGGHELYTRELRPGLHPISEATDQMILNNWVQLYNDDIWGYAAEKDSVNEMISSLIKSSNTETQNKLLHIYENTHALTLKKTEANDALIDNASNQC